MNKSKIYTYIFNFKKLFFKLFLKNNNKLLNNTKVYYLPKIY